MYEYGTMYNDIYICLKDFYRQIVKQMTSIFCEKISFSTILQMGFIFVCTPEIKCDVDVFFFEINVFYRGHPSYVY